MATDRQWPGSSPSGKTRTIVATVSKTIAFTVDESVIAQGMLPDSPIFGNRVTEDDVLQHLAFNLIGNDLRLSQIDGFANCPDASACVPYEQWDVEVESATPTPVRRIARATER